MGLGRGENRVWFTMERILSNLQNTTEESGGSDETRPGNFRYADGFVKPTEVTRMLNRLSRKLLGLKRKLKIKKTLTPKEVRLVVHLSRSTFPPVAQ